MADECRIAIVDPYPLFRKGAVEALGRDKDILVIAEGATAEDALGLVEDHQLDVLLLEAAVVNGLQAAETIVRSHPTVKVLFLASTENQDHALQALQIGAMGYVMKGISGPELVKVIKAVRDGEHYMTPDLACRLLTQSDRISEYGGAYLNTREQQVIDETLKGLTNQEIAQVLGLTVSTVKYYKSLAFRKMGVRNRVEAGLVASHSVKLKFT